MHKEQKVILRVYMTPDERDALKQIAEEQNLSLSELIATAVRKKYKLGKTKKVRQETASLCASLTASPTVSLLDNHEIPEHPSYDSEIPLDAGTSETALTSSCESVDIHSLDRGKTATSETDTNGSETANNSDDEFAYFDDLLSKGSDTSAYTDDEIRNMRNRIHQIKKIIETARATGNHLPKKQYSELVEQKKHLIAIVYANGNA